MSLFLQVWFLQLFNVGKKKITLKNFTTLWVLKKLKIELPYDPAIPLLELFKSVMMYEFAGELYRGIRKKLYQFFIISFRRQKYRDYFLIYSTRPALSKCQNQNRYYKIRKLQINISYEYICKNPHQNISKSSHKMIESYIPTT